jgi:hypothetical protein
VLFRHDSQAAKIMEWHNGIALIAYSLDDELAFF